MSRSCQRATFSSPTSARAAHDARETADALGDDRVPLVRHRGRALLALAERLLHLRTSVRARCRISSANLSSDEATTASAASSSACRSRWRICVEAGAGSRPSRSQAIRSSSGSVAAYVPTAPESLPTRIPSSARATRLAPAVELERPAGELQPERRRLGVDPVRAADAASCGAPRRARRRRRRRGRSPRGSARPASRICSASAVSTTSEEVSP